MKILITGAGGFTGSHITKAFLDGNEVSAFIRPGSPTKFLETYIRKRSLNIIRGTLDNPEDIRKAMTVSGAELVIHAAALARDWGSYQEFYRANVEGTENLLHALLPGMKLIYISSTAVLGEESCERAKGEEEEHNPVHPYFLEYLLPSSMNFYRLTKSLAEKKVLAFSKKHGITCSIVRPVWVFGPREFHSGPYEYCKTVLKGIPFMPGSKKNKFHVIYAPDLARIIRTLAENMKEGVHIYNVGAPEVPLMEDYWSLFCRALGKKKPLNLPKWLLFLPAFFLEAFYIISGIKNPPLFTRARLDMFYAWNIYDVSRAEAELMKKPLTPLDKAIKTTVRWWKIFGYLKEDAHDRS